MLAVQFAGDNCRPLSPTVPTPPPRRHPMLRAAPGVRTVQLLDRLPPRPPGPPALAHLEVLVIRPGPMSIAPNRARGGLVFGLYDGQTLLAEDEVPAPGRGPSDRMIAMALGCKRPTVLVVYDGDTGERITGEELKSMGLWTGMVL